MPTALQNSVTSALSKRQLNSLRTLQAKVDTRNYMGVTVSAAQFAAMQAAYDVAKASGNPIPPEAVAAAKALGLTV